jgi:prepilin peptidase CpaA
MLEALLSNPARGAWLATYLAMLAAACGFDLRSNRIPNAITFAGMATGLVLAALPGGIGLAAASAGLAVGGGAPFILYRVGALGAGDVKLMAAVGAFTGWPRILAVLLAIAIAGGVASIATALVAGRLRAVLANVRDGLYLTLVSAFARQRGPVPFTVSSQRVPYAVAIAAGAAIELFYIGLPA